MKKMNILVPILLLLSSPLVFAKNENNCSVRQILKKRTDQLGIAVNFNENEFFTGRVSLKQCFDEIKNAPCATDGKQETLRDTVMNRQGWNVIQMKYKRPGMFNDLDLEISCSSVEPLDINPSGFPGGWTLSVLFGIAADHASEASFQIFDSNQFSTYLEENSSSLVNFWEGRISREELEGLPWTGKNETSLVTYYFDFESSYVMCKQTPLSDYFSGSKNSMLAKLPLKLNMSNGAVCKSIYF